MDFNIELSNGLVLKGMIKYPGRSAKAVILMVHGIGEHIQRYEHVADFFKDKMIGFAGLDLPGHGRSEGKRGHVKSYSQYEEMIDILLKSCYQTFPGIPVFLYGHSLGGTIILDYLLRKNPGIKGAIITAPYLSLAYQPPQYKLLLASVLKYITPWLIQTTGLNTEYLSHDKNVVERYRNDPLIHNKISIGLFNGSLNSIKYSLKRASDLKIPTLIIHGENDKIVSLDGSREFSEKSDMTELKIWQGGYHELHNEPFKNELFTFILEWIVKRQTH